MIANLAVYFALHTLFASVVTARLGALQVQLPRPETVQGTAVLVTALAFALIFWRRWAVLSTLAPCAVVGATLYVGASGL